MYSLIKDLIDECDNQGIWDWISDPKYVEIIPVGIVLDIAEEAVNDEECMQQFVKLTVSKLKQKLRAIANTYHNYFGHLSIRVYNINNRIVFDVMFYWNQEL